MFNWLRSLLYAPVLRGIATCDLDDVPRHYRGWFYLAPERTRLVEVPDGRLEVYITLRGEWDRSYRDEAYWTQLRIARAGVVHHTYEDAHEVVRWMNQKHHFAHAD